MVKKVLSILLCLSMFLSTSSIAFAKEPAPQPNVASKVCDVIENGYTPLTTAKFFEIIDGINNAVSTVTGFKPIPENLAGVTVNGVLVDVFQGMLESSDGVLNCFDIADSIKIDSTPAKMVYDILKIDKSTLVGMARRCSDDFYSKGRPVEGFIAQLISVYFNIIKEVNIYSAKSPENPNIQEIRFTLVYEDGTTEDFNSGVVLDTESGMLYGSDGTGIVGLGYEFNTKTNTIYTSVNSWQRNFGFTVFYDIFCYVTKLFDYTTLRIKFTYLDKDWMFQIWKGNYLIAPGGEIGIYNRPTGKNTHFYRCGSDEDMLNMGMELYKGDKLIFKREPTRHWWITGFQIMPKTYIPYTLTLKGTIEFTDPEMQRLFIESASKYKQLKVTANSNVVTYIW